MQTIYMFNRRGYDEGMKLSRYTDYALRVLMHIAVRGDRASSIPEIARAYSISEDHLRKVVHSLGKAGFIATQRGRGGGLRLGRPEIEINLGSVVRHTEDSFRLVPCPECLISPVCRLPGVLNEAVQAFLGVLDKYTLADLSSPRRDLRMLFGLDEEAPIAS